VEGEGEGNSVKNAQQGSNTESQQIGAYFKTLLRVLSEDDPCNVGAAYRNFPLRIVGIFSATSQIIQNFLSNVKVIHQISMA